MSFIRKKLSVLMGDKRPKYGAVPHWATTMGRWNAIADELVRYGAPVYPEVGKEIGDMALKLDLGVYSKHESRAAAEVGWIILHALKNEVEQRQALERELAEVKERLLWSNECLDSNNARKEELQDTNTLLIHKINRSRSKRGKVPYHTRKVRTMIKQYKDKSLLSSSSDDDDSYYCVSSDDDERVDNYKARPLITQQRKRRVHMDRDDRDGVRESTQDEINEVVRGYYKERATSTDVMIAKLDGEVAARSQLISSMQHIINDFSNMVPAFFSSSLQSRPVSPEILPCAGQKGGNKVQNTRQNFTISKVLRKCKSSIVKSASLAMEQFRRSAREHSYTADSPRPNRASIRCFACSGLGHIASFCRSVRSQEQKACHHIRCFRCGNKGHIARNCHYANGGNVSCNVGIGNRCQVTNCTVGPCQLGHIRAPSPPHLHHNGLRDQKGQLQLGKNVDRQKTV